MIERSFSRVPSALEERTSCYTLPLREAQSDLQPTARMVSRGNIATHPGDEPADESQPDARPLRAAGELALSPICLSNVAHGSLSRRALRVPDCR